MSLRALQRAFSRNACGLLALFAALNAITFCALEPLAGVGPGGTVLHLVTPAVPILLALLAVARREQPLPIALALLVAAAQYGLIAWVRVIGPGGADAWLLL